MKQTISTDPCQGERTLSLPLLHKYQDNKSCERIYNIMKDL